ncbi:MAG: AhpC/TSA family protein [Muribaculaceae bacterium]|nr:AhpC/TSA family protein [Muribaculaceae bacterium]
MKKSILSLIIATSIPMIAFGDVTLKFPEGQGNGKYPVLHLLISDAVKPSSNRPEYTVDTIEVVNRIATFPVETAGASQYVIPVKDRNRIQFFTEPNDNITIDITSLDPFEFTISGSELMDGITTINKRCNDAFEIIGKAAKAEPRDNETIEATLKELDNYLTNYVKANPSNPSSIFAALRLNDEEQFLALCENLSEGLNTSPLYPILQSQRDRTVKRMEANKARQELASGTHDAPNFTLKNLEGKDVSLSDFKGKWVILDFWGSWCPWCIKGFPKLKETYAQLKPNLEIIGIDCRDKEDVWRKAVAKYELPWVNLYNPESSTILNDYLVQAFPTKAIINPEGKIVNITVGEDPTFFDALDKLMNAK